MFTRLLVFCSREFVYCIEYQGRPCRYTMYNLVLYARTKISRPCTKTDRSFQTFAKGKHRSEAYNLHRNSCIFILIPNLDILNR